MSLPNIITIARMLAVPLIVWLIITNQIPKALGLEMAGKGATFFQSLTLMADAIGTTHGLTVAFSIATALLYSSLHWKFRTLPNVAICLLVMSMAE